MAIAGSKYNPPAPGGLFTLTPTNPQDNLPGIVEHQPVIDPKPERVSVVDTQYTPATHLLAHVEGSNWTVIYYKQQLGIGDEMKPLQVGTSPAHQQYQRIEGFIFKVNSPLAQSQDQETKEFQVSGESTMFYGLIPNIGDMFLADVGDGRTGLFAITESERMSYSKDACYRIAYVMVGYNNVTYQSDLDLKTTSKVIFDLTLLELLENPFVVENDYHKLVRLKQLDQRLRKYMVERYWSPDMQTYKVPQQFTQVFDGYHANFCRTIGLMDVSRPIRIYHNGLMRYDAVTTVWSCLYEMSADSLPYCHRTFSNAPAALFKDKPVQRGIAFSPFVETIYPSGNFYTDDPCAVLYDGEWPALACEPLMINYMPTLVDRPYFYPVGGDGNYVFSQAFYDCQSENMSVLERLVFNMLSGVSVVPDELILLCNYLPKLRPIDQFYYIPVLLVLINFTRRNDLCQ